MEQIVAQLATAVAATLAPFTPYLIEGGKKFAGKAGDAAWGQAEKIWNAIRSYFADDPSITGASLMVSASPQDETTLALFAKVLAKKFESNPELTNELLELVGGHEALQEALIHGSWVGEVVQELTGTGTQSARVSDSTVNRITQKKN